MSGSRLVPPIGREPALSYCRPRSIRMLDAIMLAIGLGFFALSVAYAYACERL
jgi:hypothetical protein